MKLVLLLFLVSISSIIAQDFEITDDITSSEDALGSIPKIGSFHDLIIPVGFNDRRDQNNQILWPVLTNDDSVYTTLGMFRNGMLLETRISRNGGSIPFDEYYGEGYNEYFDVTSNGRHTLDVDFVGLPNGNPFIASNDLSYYGSGSGVIWDNYQAICTDILTQIENVYPSKIDSADAIHFIFEVGSTSSDDFHNSHGGTVDLCEYNGQNIPMSINYYPRSIVHERLHLLGLLDRKVSHPHKTAALQYDMMCNIDATPARWSLQGLRPVTVKDLEFLDWIDQDEILIINESNYQQFGQIKLADVNYSLSPSQKSQGYYRAAKIYIDDEFNDYLQLEFHNASEYDKAFSNYYEHAVQGYGYNTGILVWYNRNYQGTLVNFDPKKWYDLKVAVPYMSWENRTPVPNDDYPYGNYYRPSNWYYYDFAIGGEYDYLMDLWGNYKYIIEGGASYWNETIDWEPSPTGHYARFMSKRSDFFSNESIQNHIVNNITSTTRPSTKILGYKYDYWDFDSQQWLTYFIEAEETGWEIYNMNKHTNGSETYMSFEVGINEYFDPVGSAPSWVHLASVRVTGTFFRNPVIYWDKVKVSGDVVNYYNIYKSRDTPNNFQLVGSTPHTVFRDTTERIGLSSIGGGSADDVYYYVTTVYNTHPESDPSSDIVHTYANLYSPPEEKPSVKEEDGLPKEYAVSQNFPNPFNPSTTIKWQLPKAEHVKIEVFNMLGQRVAVLVNNKFEAGYHGVSFDASFLPSGVYIYTIKAGTYYTSKKMLLIK